MTSFQLPPEFLLGSSTSPVLQPAHGFYSKRLIMPHAMKIESEPRAAARTEAMPPSSYFTVSVPHRNWSEIEILHPGPGNAHQVKVTALPISKTTNLKSLSKSPLPPLQPTSRAAQEQQRHQRGATFRRFRSCVTQDEQRRSGDNRPKWVQVQMRAPSNINTLHHRVRHPHHSHHSRYQIGTSIPSRISRAWSRNQHRRP